MKRGNVAQITLRIPLEMDDRLLALAKQRHVTKTTVIRNLLEQGVSMNAYQNEEEEILENMKLAMREVLDPQVDRMVKIMVKNAIAASVNLLYTSMMLYRISAKEIRPKLEIFMEEARIMGIRFVQLGKGNIEGFLKSSMEKLNQLWDSK